MTPKVYLKRLARWTSLILMLSLVVGVTVSKAAPAMLDPDAIARTKSIASVSQSGQFPMTFIENAGQSAPEVQFLVRGKGSSLFFTPDTVAFVLSNPNNNRMADALKLQFDGANANVQIQGTDQLPGVVNSFIGNDPSRWHSHIATYGAITYADLYPGIDLRYEGKDGALKGTYTVAAGADASQIGWHYAGANSLQVDAATGALQVALPDGNSLTEEAPLVWQDIGNTRIPVSAHYALDDNNHVHFTLGSYDRNYPLTIDPTTQYSTYVGGSGPDTAWGVAADANGFTYIMGTTELTDFPTTAGVLKTSIGTGADDFVVKIDTNASGAASLVWATYLGGTTGAEDNYGRVAVDPSGNVYVTGTTVSADFPITSGTAIQTTPGGLEDAFLVKLDPTGANLLYGTYIGGTNSDQGYGLAVDSSGNAYVCGYTKSPNFPVTSGTALDTSNPTSHTKGFVTRINTTLSGSASLVYSTYFGGATKNVIAQSVAADDAGNVYVTGHSEASDMPTTPNAYQPALNIGNGGADGFLSRFDTTLSGSASLVYSTFLGGNRGENQNVFGTIAIDGNGVAYLTGETNSTDFPFKNGFQSVNKGAANNTVDAFVSAIDTTLSGQNSLLYSTYLGGSDVDQGTGIAYAGDGVIYVAGTADSDDFPMVGPLYAFSGTAGFVSKIDTLFSGSAALIFSSYLPQQANITAGIGLDGSGSAIVAGQTNGTTFPVINGFQSTMAGGGGDGFLFKYGFSADLETTQTVSSNVALIGDDFTINISVKNKGSDTGTGILLDEPLPPNVNFVSANSNFGTCAYQAPDVRCHASDIPRSQMWTITITINPQSGTQAVLTATADGTEKDPVSANDAATNTVTVTLFTDQIPTLLTPTDGTSTTTNPITLTWSPIFGATHYNIRFGSTNPPVTTAATAVTGTSYTFPSALPAGTSYWQVQGVSAGAQMTQWSAPNSVNIISPVNSAAGENYFTTTTPTLTWGRTNGAIGYEVDVSNKSTFSPILFSDNAIPADQLSERVTTDLPSGTYYWRVRAKLSATTWSAYSPTESFIINAP